MDTSPVVPLASNAGKVGDVYRDILEWSAPLPRWQSELLRRVLRGKELTTEDISEPAVAAVAENEQQASSYAALSEADLPSVAASSEQRLLVSVGQVRNVNALRPDQTLKSTLRRGISFARYHRRRAMPPSRPSRCGVRNKTLSCNA